MPDADGAKRIKAYNCYGDYSGYSTVVFAESAGEARYIAIKSDTLGDDLEFKDVYVRRIPALDGYYKGKKEMDWYDPDDRLAMVKIAGYMCDEDGFDPDECKKCSSKDYCGKWEEYRQDVEDGIYADG